MDAIGYLRRLQSEVGPRRAGTPGEARARAWLLGVLGEVGVLAEEREYAFLGSPLVRYAIAWVRNMALFVFLLFSRQLDSIIVLGGVVLHQLYSSRLHPRLMLRLARTRSQNILASLEKPFSEHLDEPQRPTLLICAHYDTPQNLPRWIVRMIKKMRSVGPLLSMTMLTLFAVLFLMSVFNLLDMLFGVGSQALTALSTFWIKVGYWIMVAVFVPQLLLITIYILDLLLREHGDSPGADDNGSGVALVLEMIERLKKSPPANLETFFAFWGAEELGLYGSRQFVRQYGGRLDKGSTYIVNADVVGVGEKLLIHTGQGVMFRRKTDPEIVTALIDICEALDVAYLRSWESPISGGSSDHAEWAERGFSKAVSLLRENPKKLSWPARALAFLLRVPDPAQFDIEHVHTPEDTIDIIREDVLAATVDVCEAYVRWIDAHAAVEQGTGGGA
ncbi:MAG: M20/M25/M40 family metallo-hydrolase [Anaerolineales bacterium]|nr:M20/M25/M40 family metallo-hydrolase [Anaerolineales bacterium]